MNKFFRENQRKICILFPVLLGLIYLLLCLPRLGVSITKDEAQLDFVSKLSFSEILSGNSDYSQPPLTVIILKLWSIVFDHNIITTRFLSTIFGIITILFTFKLVNYKYKTKAACLSATLLTFCPFFIYCGSIIWFCTLFSALFVISSFLLQLYLDSREKKWIILYFAAATLGIWTHYLFALVWLVHIIYLVICRRRKELLGFAAPILLFAPQFSAAASYFSYIHKTTGDFQLGSLANFWTEATGLISTSALKNLAVLILLAYTTIFAFMLFRNKRQKFFVLAFAVPMATIVILCALRVMPFPPARCLVCAIVSMPIFMGIAIARSPKKRWRNLLFVAAIAACSVLGLFNLYSNNCSAIACSDADRIFLDIEAFALEGEPIVTYESDLFFELKYYETNSHPVITPSETGEFDYWLVATGDITYDKDRLEVLSSATLNYSKSYYLYKLSLK